MTQNKSSLTESLLDSLESEPQVPVPDARVVYDEKFAYEIDSDVEKQHSFTIMHPFFDSSGNKIGYYLPEDTSTQIYIHNSYNDARYEVFKNLDKEAIVVKVSKYTRQPNSYPSLFLDMKKTVRDLANTSVSLKLPSPPLHWNQTPLDWEFKRHLEMWS